jgi:hypothetical protein
MLPTQIPSAAFSSQLLGPQIAPANPHNKLSSAWLSGFAQDYLSHSIPIGRASCSGLVQSIFSPPARPLNVLTLSSAFYGRARRAKNALHYAESRTMPNRHQHASSGAHRTAVWLMPITGRMRHSPFAPLSRDPILQGAGEFKGSVPICLRRRSTDRQLASANLSDGLLRQVRAPSPNPAMIDCEEYRKTRTMPHRSSRNAIPVR